MDGVLKQRRESIDPFAGADVSEAELTSSGANSLDWRERSRLSIGGGDANAVPTQFGLVSVEWLPVLVGWSN